MHGIYMLLHDIQCSFTVAPIFCLLLLLLLLLLSAQFATFFFFLFIHRDLGQIFNNSVSNNKNYIERNIYPTKQKKNVYLFFIFVDVWQIEVCLFVTLPIVDNKKSSFLPSHLQAWIVRSVILPKQPQNRLSLPTHPHKKYMYYFSLH